MDFIREVNAFERWLETNHLPMLAQLLWYKLFMLNNRAGWCEWIQVDNQRLMVLMGVESKNTFLRARDKLVEAGIVAYQKGKKGSPNRYKISSLLEKGSFNELQMEPQVEPQTGLQTEPQTGHISKLKENKKENKTYVENFFESIWQLYPKKEGKGSVSATQKQKLFKIGLDEMARAIERCKQAKAGTEMRYWKNGGTFFNSGYVDYLDANWAEPTHPERKVLE